MASDDDEYYDSIDDTEYRPSSCSQHFKSEESGSEDHGKFYEMVPYYDGEVDKSEIDSGKNASISFNYLSCVNKKPKRIRRAAPVPTQKKRSYLTMYTAKNRLVKKEVTKDTFRATCASLTPRTDLSYGCDDISTDGMARHDRLFDRFLEKDKSEDDCGNEEASSTLADINDSILVSISQMQLKISPRMNESKGSLDIKPLSCTKSRITKPSEMDTLLCPSKVTTDKMLQLRKRQEYGKAASERNRIKFRESQIIRKLQQEIRDSKF